MSEIVKTARENDVRIVIFTDMDFMRWQYGLWPLRGVIKKTVQMNSIYTYGIRRYLKEIADLQAKNQDMVIIPAVESAPFYYWEGSPFKKDLKLYNWYRHLLVIGLEDPADYRRLPSLSNDNSLALPFRF